MGGRAKGGRAPGVPPSVRGGREGQKGGRADGAVDNGRIAQESGTVSCVSVMEGERRGALVLVVIQGRVARTGVAVADNGSK